MTTDIEDQLTASMRQEVDGVALTTDVLGSATRRHHRRTVLLRTTYAIGVLGLATAGALALNGVAPTTAKPPVAVAETPRLKLVAAATASENLSYRMRLKDGLTYEGAFDPNTDTGYVRAPQDDSVTTELLINGTRYIGGEAPLTPLPPDKAGGHEKYGRYGQYPGKYDHLSLYGGSSTVLGAASPDPAALFAALKKLDATVTEGADGRLHFEYATTGKDGSSTTAGDVTRDAAGRISRVATTTMWQSTAKGRLDKGTVTSTLDLFDYGVPVTVKRPADVVMAK